MKDFEKSWGAIEPNYLIELKSETAILNMRRTRLFLESILALQIMTYIILLIVSHVSATYEFHYRSSLLLFFGLLIFSVVEYFIIGHLEKMFIDRKITTEIITVNLWIVVGFITSWSALLSVMSSGNDTMSNLFMLSLMITSFMFYIDAKPQGVIYGISIGIYLIGHYAFGSRALLTIDFLNLIIFALLAWIVSRINYQSYIGFYTDQCIINDKNLLLQEINSDLSHEVVEKQEILRELESANATLKKISAIDDLTSVPNRRKLNEIVHYEWRRSQRERNDIAIFMIDVDHFKLFNDSYGHVLGDEVLRKVAGALNQFSMRPTDFFARYGGEEFTFLAINMNKNNVLHFANRMRAAVEGLKIVHETSDTNKYLTISIGVTIAQPYMDDRIEKAFNRSDMALYLSKKDGRNTMRYIDFKDQQNCEKRGI